MQTFYVTLCDVFTQAFLISCRASSVAVSFLRDRYNFQVKSTTTEFCVYIQEQLCRQYTKSVLWWDNVHLLHVIENLPRATSTWPLHVGASPPVTRLVATKVRAPSRIFVLLVICWLTSGRHCCMTVPFLNPVLDVYLCVVSLLCAKRLIVFLILL